VYRMVEEWTTCMRLLSWIYSIIY